MSDQGRGSSPDASRDYDRIVREHLDAEAKRVRPFCGQWPFASSDLDVVMPEQNDAVHRARGCCDGPSAPASSPSP